jgi:arylsulfatase A-like enzyme
MKLFCLGLELRPRHGCLCGLFGAAMLVFTGCASGAKDSGSRSATVKGKARAGRANPPARTNPGPAKRRTRKRPHVRPTQRSATQKQAQELRPPAGYGVAFDFWHNRASAVYRPAHGILVPCAKPDFAKYVDGTWKNPWILGAQIDGRSVAYVYRKKAKLYLPGLWLSAKKRTDSEQALGKRKAVVELVFHNPVRRQRIYLRINGRYVKVDGAMQEGRQRLRFEVDASLFRAGENRIKLTFRRTARFKTLKPPDYRSAGYYSMRWVRRVRSAGALEAIGVGAAGFKLPADGPRLSGFATHRRLAGKSVNGFAVPADGALSYYLLVPAKGRLRFRYRAHSPGRSAGAVRFQVWVKKDGKPAQKRYEKIVSGPGDADGGAVVDLSAYAGQAVRLDFRNQGGAGFWHGLQLWGLRSPKVEVKKHPIKYVFFWLADALRRDCVGAYGSKVVKTPHFDKLASEGVLFERPTIQGNHSKPSHGTILTGTYPPVHGFVHKKSRVRGPLIYQLFKKAGWKTALFSSNGYISRSWGFARGLDRYLNFIRRRMDSDAESLWKHAHRFIKRNRDDKIFVYLLTIDPHVTYGPPRKYLKMYYPERYRGPVPRRATGFFLEKLITGRIRLRRRRDLKRLKALYYGEITYNDHWFGRMRSALEKMGIWKQSVIVIGSDHGDQFKEHGSFGHAKNLHEEEIAVPLILWWPGLPDRGVRISGDVEVMDIYSTLLDLAQIPQNGSAQSASLLDRVRGDRAEAMHAAYAYHAGVSRSVTMGRYKLISVHGRKYSVYDLHTDPKEQKPCNTSHPVALRLLRNVFSLHNAYLTEWRKTRWRRAANLTPAFNRDTR